MRTTLAFLLVHLALYPGANAFNSASWSADDGWALAVTCAVVASLYPVTQVYQLDADQERRDRTLAAVLDARGTLAWSAGAFAVAAAALAAAGSAGLAAYVGGSALAAAALAAVWPTNRVPSHRAVMAAPYLTSTVFLLALLR